MGGRSGWIGSRAAASRYGRRPMMTACDPTPCRRASFTTGRSRFPDVRDPARRNDGAVDDQAHEAELGSVGLPPVLVVEQIDEGVGVYVHLDGGGERRDRRRLPRPAFDRAQLLGVVRFAFKRGGGDGGGLRALTLAGRQPERDDAQRNARRRAESPRPVASSSARCEPLQPG